MVGLRANERKKRKTLQWMLNEWGLTHLLSQSAT